MDSATTWPPASLRRACTPSHSSGLLLRGACAWRSPAGPGCLRRFGDAGTRGGGAAGAAPAPGAAGWAHALPFSCLGLTRSSPAQERSRNLSPGGARCAQPVGARPGAAAMPTAPRRAAPRERALGGRRARCVSRHRKKRQAAPHSRTFSVLSTSNVSADLQLPLPQDVAQSPGRHPPSLTLRTRVERQAALPGPAGHCPCLAPGPADTHSAPICEIPGFSL